MAHMNVSQSSSISVPTIVSVDRHRQRCRNEVVVIARMVDIYLLSPRM
jgi:hypothetical protein